MDVRPQVMIVADTLVLAKDLLGWLAPGGYQSTIATTFASAKTQLRTHPDLVIAQLKLREYNGLHVALRARCEGIPAIVIGDPDTVLERDAEQLGVTFVRSDELGRERILGVVQDLIPAETAAASGAWVPALIRGARRRKTVSRPSGRTGSGPSDRDVEAASTIIGSI